MGWLPDVFLLACDILGVFFSPSMLAYLKACLILIGVIERKY